MSKKQIKNKKILVSSCLIGKPCAYDGKDRLKQEVVLACEKYGCIDICPEIDGGLACPRNRNEIKHGDGRDVISGKASVSDSSGGDNTEAFLRGAEKAVKICLENKIKISVMKSKSPSCGKYKIHNGRFDGTLIDGNGVTAAMLKKNNIKVFTEKEIPQVENEMS